MGMSFVDSDALLAMAKAHYSQTLNKHLHPIQEVKATLPRAD